MLDQNMRKAVKGVLAGLALLTLAGNAYSATITFQNPGADKPTNSYDTGGICNGTSITSIDLCEQGSGFNYLKSGLNLNVTADNTNGDAALMQDLWPSNSGLAVISSGDSSSDDQVQVATGESILFDFGQRVSLIGFDFNDGNDTDCNPFGSEGPCGYFDLSVDGSFVGNYAAVDDLVFGTALSGKTFKVAHSGPMDGGFSIGSVTAVPEPGTLALLGLGLVGLGASYRRRS